MARIVYIFSLIFVTSTAKGNYSWNPCAMFIDKCDSGSPEFTIRLLGGNARYRRCSSNSFKESYKNITLCKANLAVNKVLYTARYSACKFRYEYTCQETPKTFENEGPTPPFIMYDMPTEVTQNCRVPSLAEKIEYYDTIEECESDLENQ